MEPKFDRELTEIGYPSGSHFCQISVIFASVLGPPRRRAPALHIYGVWIAAATIPAGERQRRTLYDSLGLRGGDRRPRYYVGGDHSPPHPPPRPRGVPEQCSEQHPPKPPTLNQ